jgi:hypothetical protein
MGTGSWHSESFYVLGDHLKSPRFAYWHHGLYIGSGLVIHYSGFANEIKTGTIEIARLEEFADGNDIEVVPHYKRPHTRSESVDRAYQRLGEDWYNLVLNNCEHFVNWCIEGSHESPQVSSVTGKVASAAAAAYMKNNPALQAVLIDKVRQFAATMAQPATEKAARSIVASSFATPIVAATGTVLGSTTAQPVASVVLASGIGSSAVSNLVAGAGAGAVYAAAGTSVATTALTGLAGTAAIGALGAAALPLTAALGVGYGIKKLWDWW